MAQIVRYFENPGPDAPCYSEGPFVVVPMTGYRIEVEYKGSRCPALPDVSVYREAEIRGLNMHKTSNADQALKTCDTLNQWFHEGVFEFNKYGVVVARSPQYRLNKSLRELQAIT